MSLDRYYSGDAAWEHYAGVWIGEWQKCAFKETLLKACLNDQLLAQTVYGLFGAHSMEWLQQPVPALDNETPVAKMTTERGLRALRECLLRCPSP